MPGCVPTMLSLHSHGALEFDRSCPQPFLLKVQASVRRLKSSAAEGMKGKSATKAMKKAPVRRQSSAAKGMKGKSAMKKKLAKVKFHMQKFKPFEGKLYEWLPSTICITWRGDLKKAMKRK